MQQHLPRTLTFLDVAGQRQCISDSELANLPRPLVILGEPGLGKTSLLEALAARPGFILIPATKLVHWPASALVVPDGGALLIDALDELSAARDSDPVCRILGKLVEAGCPPFILSCRASEWSGAIARRDIAEDYRSKPLQLWLDPFTRETAVAFLARTLSADAAEFVIAHLGERNIPDLYGNPLTLTLIGEVYQSNQSLPDTRVEILEASTRLLWRERPDRRMPSALATLDAEKALSAAGLISAVFVLTGADSISLKPSGAVSDDCVHVPDLHAFAGGAHAPVIMGSRLFPPVAGSDDKFRPIHRTVAEFLGASWLAAATHNDLMRDRVISMLTIDDGVAASLRGLHAWLARDPRFTEHVIRSDPFGLMRYGDADNLSVPHARLLLRELVCLHQSNPLFRSEDWHPQRARALGRPELIDDIRAVLFAQTDGWQLRSLILDAIAGSELASLLRDDLQAVVLNRPPYDFGYAERHDASRALLQLDNPPVDWPTQVASLIEQRGEDATRLAIEIMTDLMFAGFSADVIVNALLVHYDLDLKAEERGASSAAVGSLYYIGRKFPAELIAPVLDGLDARLPPRNPDLGPELPFELSSLILRLIARQIQLSPPPASILRWLSLVSDRHGGADEDRQLILSYLAANIPVRRAIQQIILLSEPERNLPHHAVWRTRRISAGLALEPGDIVATLNAMAALAHPADHHVTTWQQLVAAGASGDAGAAVLAAARPFAAGKADLEAFLEKVQQPQAPEPWEIEQEQRRYEHLQQRQDEWAKHRAHFAAHEHKLRSGELRFIYPIAQAYLGLFSDFDKQSPPVDRLVEWLGEPLAASGLAGLGATLGRQDLPTPEQVSDSYAEQRRKPFILPMIAGVAEFVRLSGDITALPADLRIAVLIGFQNEHLGDRVQPNDLAERIEASLREPALFERYIRLLIEPSLARERDHIPGLYAFVRSAADRQVAQTLCQEWLSRFADLPYQTELELIDGASGASARPGLVDLARARLAAGLPTDDRRRAWQAVLFTDDFEAFSSAYPTIGTDDPELIWPLRHRLGDERHSAHQALALAPRQLAWIISQLRTHWPYCSFPEGGWSGDRNAWDASQFISSCITRLAADSSDDASTTLFELVSGPRDAYTPYLQNAVAQQRRIRRDRLFAGPTIADIRAALDSRPPSSTADLSAIVFHALTQLQAKLCGSDVDRARKYRRDDGSPHDEDTCTDLLIQDLEHLLAPYHISMIPQRDMPADKRADIVFQHGHLELPAECKGQWHKDLWHAATEQLDRMYARDWHAQDRGIYIVYWFGYAVPPSKRLKHPPDQTPIPSSPTALAQALRTRLGPDRLASIAVAVVDLTP